ncbi:unnamed protein product [Lactuca virosa]|uniref:F-box domain-containing protein n=1 Tax=Lactuca virosa TaxID=75947 RepID=A0AAU9PEA1_9ASTR|nr:unnamed protein product [Lactuca virosa]
MASTSAVETLSVRKESPNWLDMPHELMADILQRLRTAEKLRSAGQVCRTWRRICKDPAMWKVIDINKWQDGCDTNQNLEMLIKQAVDLSCGELIDISIEGFCTDDLLHHIVLRSRKLKRLSLRCCFDMTSSGLSRGVKRVPHELEKLHINCPYMQAKDIEVIGRNCSQLKSFKICMITRKPFIIYTCDDHAVAIANNMPELRHLQIYGDEMTNDGLEAILNGCPHLQSLDIYMRCRFNLDGNLVQRCVERIKDFKHS